MASILDPILKDGPDKICNLINLLRYRSLQLHNQTAFIFLVDGENEEIRLTYKKLDQLSRTIAAHLQSLGIEGKHALLLYPPGMEYISAFFGCLYAGVVAVPAYPPDPTRLDRTVTRLFSIAKDAQPSVVLTVSSILDLLKEIFKADTFFENLQWLATDSFAIEAGDEWKQPAVTSENLAFLQYTSGSTAAPRGAMVSHGNLLHNLALIQSCFEHSHKSRGVIWLPPYHDMGLIGGILQPLYGGFPVTLMSPLHFLQKPYRWLQAVSRCKATTSGGPNFAYELCVRKISPEQRNTLDLSSWEVAFNGAEPIRSQTMEQFAEAFKSCGFRREALYPCYGLAEATLIASGGSKNAYPILQTVQTDALQQNKVVYDNPTNRGARHIVGCGRALKDQQIVIVDPEKMKHLKSDEIGEIWLSGPSIAQGYYNRAKETDNIFRNFTKKSKEGPFLRTGDLGFLHDGELFLTGRLKDLMIIHGINYYPQDIELSVEKSHPALRAGCGAVFSVEIDGDEQVVAVQEVKRGDQEHLDVTDVVMAIRQAVWKQHGLQLFAILLLKPSTIFKTSSGKIQRRACRTGFLADSLESIEQWRKNALNKEGTRFSEGKDDR